MEEKCRVGAWEKSEATRTSSFGKCAGLLRRGLYHLFVVVITSQAHTALRGNLTQLRLMEDVELRG